MSFTPSLVYCQLVCSFSAISIVCDRNMCNLGSKSIVMLVVCRLFCTVTFMFCNIAYGVFFHQSYVNNHSISFVGLCSPFLNVLIV